MAHSSPAYRLVTNPAELQSVAAALDNTRLIGLDIETTGLNSRRDRMRLLSLSCETIGDNRFAYLVDVFKVNPCMLFDVLAGKELVIHNAAFDLAFLSGMGFSAGIVHDTMMLSRLLYAGENVRHRLGDCAARELAQNIDKAEQTSDWSGMLTAAQLEYAARDVEILPSLYAALSGKIRAAQLGRVAAIEQRCLPAIVWMGGKGVAFDRDAWHALARTAHKDAERLGMKLNQDAPPKPGELFDAAWNWDSPVQVKDALAAAGCQVDDTGDDTLAAANHPLADLLRQYRDARKRCTTYGTAWLKHIADDGRVYASWRQLGAASGRMSCSDPNMQQLPRGEYRRCVVAPPGRVLVKADYSQIELRIAAKVSGDQALLDAYLRGEDLHSITAKNVLGIHEVTKEDRQLAKALNFGLLYGMGARGSGSTPRVSTT